MKDYYYFLGLKNDASDEDIRRAYRKLSLKYHPDVNKDDDFFNNRFQEIQEAYDTLIHPESRRAYDAGSGDAKPARSRQPPVIRSFSANKIRGKKGEEIIITWRKDNADLVKILPFGLEKPYGERAFKITEFTGGKFHIVLQATNTLTGKAEVRGMTISEIFENNTAKFTANVQQDPQKPLRTPGKPQGIAFSRLLILILLIILAIIAYFSSSHY